MINQDSHPSVQRRAVHAGSRRLPAMPGYRTRQDRPDGYGLPPRESAVLGLLADNLTAAAIARNLAISISTVNTHLEHVYRKLGTNNRLTTVLLAREAGLVETRDGVPI